MVFVEEEFEDTEELIRIRKSKGRQHNGQKEKGQTTIYKILHWKLIKDRATWTPW